MEAERLLASLAFLFAFVAAACLFVMLVGLLRKKERSVASTRSAGGKDSFLRSILRNGVHVFVRPARRLLRVGAISRYGMLLEKTASEKDYVTEAEALMSALLAALLLLGLGGLLIARSAIFALVAVLLVLVTLHLWAKHVQEARHEALREAIPEALQTMKACFCVGCSLPQTFDRLAEEVDGPLGEVFGEVAAVLNAGGSVEEGLEKLKALTDEQELIFLAAALEIQHKTGSSMQHILEVAHDSVKDELELKRSLQTQTAQAKLSARIVTLMPFVLIGLFSLSSEGFLDPFFESIPGVFLLIVALSMQAAGVLIVRRLLKVDVV